MPHGLPCKPGMCVCAPSVDFRMPITVPRSPGKLRVLVARHATSIHAPLLHASTAKAITCQYARSMRLPQAPQTIPGQLTYRSALSGCRFVIPHRRKHNIAFVRS